METLFLNANKILVDEVQLEKEKSYIVPTESETKTKAKMNKL
jgi:hypothetical protein